MAQQEIFAPSIGIVDLLYLSVFIFSVNLYQFLILCSSKALLFVKLYFCTSDIYIISLVSLNESLRLSKINRCDAMKKNQSRTCTALVVVNISEHYLNNLFGVVSVVQLVVSMSGVVLGGVVEYQSCSPKDGYKR